MIVSTELMSGLGGLLPLAHVGDSAWFFVFPVLFGLVYALSAIIIKRGMKEGVGPWRTTFVVNLAMGGVSSTLLLLDGGTWQGWANIYQPLLPALTFFLGQIFTFLALSHGDVSVATPLMGTKILFVALFGLLLFHVQVSWALWGAAVLAAMAVFLLGANTPQNRKKILITIFLALCSAALFGLTDALLQAWARDWGFQLFVPIMFMGFAVLSFGFIPFFRGGFRSVPRKVWYWLAPGALLIAMQSTGLAVQLGLFGRATEINILYSTRGLWSVVLIWYVGSWFGNYEKHLGPKILLRRLLGAVLLLLSVILITLDKDEKGHELNQELEPSAEVIPLKTP